MAVTWSSSNYAEPDGAFGGDQIGYNWQRDRFIFGVEGDLQASDINASNDVAFGNATTDIDWFSTVRGRVGIAAGPWLLYGTGGVAFGDIANRLDIGPDTRGIRRLKSYMQSAAVLTGPSRETGAPGPSIFTSVLETPHFPAAATKLRSTTTFKPFASV
jgi:opacity protein-like surface antigen